MEFPRQIAVSLFRIFALTILTKTESVPGHPALFVAVTLYHPALFAKKDAVVFPLDQL